MLSKNAAYAPDWTPLNTSVSADQSREVAYAIMAYINAEDVGEPRRARLESLVTQAYGHMDQWFVTKNAPYVRPFMVSLTSHALITYYERTGDLDPHKIDAPPQDAPPQVAKAAEEIYKPDQDQTDHKPSRRQNVKRKT